MQILTPKINQSAIQRRNNLQKFGDTSKIVKIESNIKIEFNIIQDTPIEVQVSQETAKSNVYIPSFTYTPPVVDTTHYKPPVSCTDEFISIKISNYALDISRDELLNILKNKTQIKFNRFHMVMDRETGESKGYCFITVCKTDASKVIEDLKIVIIVNLRLCVEIAKNKVY